MANQYEDEDYDEVEETQQDPNGPANLRKALKRAEKEKKELAEQLAAIQSDLRNRSVKDVLANKGVSEKIAKFIPSDVTTPEQIDSWLTENGDIFGITKPEEVAAQEAEKQDAIRAYQRINAATQNANTPSRDQDVAAKLASDALTKADLDAMTGNAMKRRF
jgi:hypothetical protein